MMVAVQVSVSKSENERPEHYQPLIKGDSGMKVKADDGPSYHTRTKWL